MKRFLILAIAALLSWPVFAHEGEKEFRRTVVVLGEGKISAVPDIATLSIEVSEEGASLDEITAQARTKMSRILEVLKKQAIAEKDIQTQSFVIQPRLQYDKGGNAKRNGYRVTNRISAKVREIQKAGKILSVVVDAGATQVNGPNFEVDNPQKLEREALKLAVEDARAKAQILAQAAGATLGAVQTIAPMGGPVWPMANNKVMRMSAMQAQAEEPIAVGEQTVTANVTVTYELK